MKKNDGVDFATINVILPSVRGFKESRNSWVSREKARLKFTNNIVLF